MFLLLNLVLKSPWQRGNRNWLLFILKWPINLLLWLTIPDPHRRSYYKYLTFLMTLIWIAGVTYLTAFVITVIGRFNHILHLFINWY